MKKIHHYFKPHKIIITFLIIVFSLISCRNVVKGIDIFEDEFELFVQKDIEYTGDIQEITLGPGTYKLEVWGAQGGNSNNSGGNPGGKGGYSTGTITLNAATTFYLYIGGAGTQVIGTSVFGGGGFNGGGDGSTWNDGNTFGGGGGATDIRISIDSVYHRVIVGGGGGGATSNGKSIGGCGGGISGGNGGESSGFTIGIGGSQIYAGNGGDAGSFGIGGSSHNTTSAGWVGGGGSGWYGGGSGGAHCAGGGGSGWVYTESSYSAWESGNPTDAAQWQLDSSYYLTEAKTIAGDQNFLAPGGATETGHSGNGYARITKLE